MCERAFWEDCYNVLKLITVMLVTNTFTHSRFMKHWGPTAVPLFLSVALIKYDTNNTYDSFPLFDVYNVQSAAYVFHSHWCDMYSILTFWMVKIKHCLPDFKNKPLIILSEQNVKYHIWSSHLDPPEAVKFNY